MFLILELPQGGWQAEKAYVAECVFRNFLGFENFSIREGTASDWVLRCTDAGGGEQRLHFPNLFFPESDFGLYLTANHLDVWRMKVRTLSRSALQVPRFPEEKIPLLFCRVDPTRVRDIDIFGTIFF